MNDEDNKEIPLVEIMAATWLWICLLSLVVMVLWNTAIVKTWPIPRLGYFQVMLSLVTLRLAMGAVSIKRDVTRGKLWKELKNGSIALLILLLICWVVSLFL